MTQASYAVLGLPVSASAEEVRQAYKSLALRWHPDKIPDAARRAVAAQRFVEIRDAYEAIGNAQSAAASRSDQSPAWQEDLARQRREREQRNEAWRRERELHERRLLAEEAERRRLRAEKDAAFDERIKFMRGVRRSDNFTSFTPSFMRENVDARPPACAQKPMPEEDENGDATPTPGIETAIPIPKGFAKEDAAEMQRHEQWLRRRSEILSQLEMQRQAEEASLAARRKKAEECKQRRIREDEDERQRRGMLDEFERKREEEEDERRRRRHDEQLKFNTERRRIEERTYNRRSERAASFTTSIDYMAANFCERAWQSSNLQERPKTAEPPERTAKGRAPHTDDVSFLRPSDEASFLRPKARTDDTSDRTARGRASSTDDASFFRPSTEVSFLFPGVQGPPRAAEPQAPEVRDARSELREQAASVLQAQRLGSDREQRRPREELQPDRKNGVQLKRRERWDHAQTQFLDTLRQIDDFVESWPQRSNGLVDSALQLP